MISRSQMSNSKPSLTLTGSPILKRTVETALKVLRFYHLGLTQMHELDANSSAQAQLVGEIDAHKAKMHAMGIDTEQTRLDPAWLETLKSA